MLVHIQCVCVCVRERERECLCACVCVCVCVSVCVGHHVVYVRVGIEMYGKKCLVLMKCTHLLSVIYFLCLLIADVHNLCCNIN